MKTLDACTIINQARKERIVVSTMGAMIAFDQLNAAMPRVNSVPLMGGSAGLGLGLALGRSNLHVVVVDGDSSLLLQLGVLASVARQAPSNFHHFVIHNKTQFTGMSNLALSGPDTLSFCDLALAAGYPYARRYDNTTTLANEIDAVLALPGPVMVELMIKPEPPRFSPDNVQQDWTDAQFTRMAKEMQALQTWLQQKEPA